LIGIWKLIDSGGHSSDTTRRIEHSALLTRC
jgi:hypothetical protein